MFEALRQHDWPAFAERELAERASAGLPPLSHQALLRADARELAVAQGLLDAVRAHWQAEQGERAQAGDGAARHAEQQGRTTIDQGIDDASAQGVLR